MAGYCVIKYAHQAEPSRVVYCPDGANVVGIFFIFAIIAQVISYCVRQYYQLITRIVCTRAMKNATKRAEFTALRPKNTVA